MGKTFKRIVLCSTNDFHPSKNDKIKGWVEHHGGTFTTDLTPQVTHLLTSTKVWKRYLPIVKEARRRRNVKIVKLDWLEDSLLQQSRRPLDTAKYEFEQRSIKKMSQKLSKASRSTKIAQAGHELDRACEDFEKDMGVAGYHPYSDSNGFVHMVHLVRRDILKNRVEKHRLKLFESDAEPHTYACYTTYTRPGYKFTPVVAPPGSSWDFAWDLFRAFFKKRCGVDWDSRNSTTEFSDDVFRYEAQGVRSDADRLSARVIVDSASVEKVMSVRAATPEGGW